MRPPDLADAGFRALPLSARGGARRLAHWIAAGAAALLAAKAAAQGTPPPVFDVERYVVQGNTVLTAERLDSTLRPYTGTQRTFTDVQAAVAALQTAYARAGYGAVTVVLPEQRIESGRVRLDVIEPRLERVALDGAPQTDSERIRRILPALQEGLTPNTAQLARELRLANENPARRFSIDLHSEAPDRLEAVVTVQEEKPWRVGVVLDDTGTPATGRYRIGTFLQHADVLDRGHVATLQYITAPGRLGEVSIAALNYRVPLPELGDALDLFAVHADVDSGVVGDLFTVRGRGDVAGMRYTHTFDPTASVRQRLTFGLERRAFGNRVAVVGGPGGLVPDVTVRPVSLGYGGAWADAGQQLDFSATLFHNLPGGGNGRVADIAAARSGAKADYTLVRWSASYLQTLPADWQLRLATDGQTSRDALVPGEQYGVGGQESVRGFLEREFVNDSGQRVTLEVYGADFGARVAPAASARLLAFIDHGSVRRNRALPGETTRAEIASAGVGLRLSVAPSWNLRFDVAHVLKGSGLHPSHDDRVHFSLGYAW